MKVELSGHYGYSRILKTMAPMVMTMIITSVYTMVDGFFVSNFTGNTAFAGMNLIWPPIQILASLGLMMGSGGSALVSKLLGEGKPDKASEVFSMLVSVFFILGIVLAVVAYVFMPQLSILLGSDENMLEYCVLYGRIVILSLPCYIMHLAFQSFFMTAERPELGTKLSIVCGLVNIGLDALLIVVFGMGLKGAAIGTAMSLCLGGLFPVFYFKSGRNTTHLQLVRASIDPKALLKACSNGASEFVGSIALSIVGIFYNLQLMKYLGENGVSAYGVLMYVGFFFAAVFIGYDQGMSQIVAYNYGAGNKPELKSLLRKSIVIVFVSGVLICSLSEAFSGTIAGFFFGFDEELCSLTARALRIYMLSFIICGLNMFASAWFTALNNGAVSAAAAFARTLVFELSAVFVMPLILGIDGIWTAVNVAEFLALILSVILLLSFRKRYGY